MERLKIVVIGGSASTNITLASHEDAWPSLLQSQKPDNLSLKHISKGGLTLTRALDILADQNESYIPGKNEQKIRNRFRN